MELTRRRLALAAVAGLVLMLAILLALGVLGAPSIASMDNAWGEVDDDRVEVLTALEVDNPNPVGLGYAVSSANYTIHMNDVGLATGGTDDLDLPRGRSTVDLSTDVHTERIPPWWASHLQHGETSDLRIDAEVGAHLGPISSSPSITHTDTVETDLIGTIDAGLEEMEGEHRGPEIGIGSATVQPRVDVRDTAARWGPVTREQTALLLDVSVHNPNDYPIPTPAFVGDLTFNEVAVGEWAADEVELTNGSRDATIGPGETEALTFSVTIDNDRLGEWFPTHVDRDERTSVRLAGQLAFELNGHVVTVPPEGDALVCTFDLRTAILVDQRSGMSNRSCQPAGFDRTPGSDPLESIGAGLELDPSIPSGRTHWVRPTDPSG
ncbi:MAG: LEA type 2 family protein [Halobacteriales archaeon]